MIFLVEQWIWSFGSSSLIKVPALQCHHSERSKTFRKIPQREVSDRKVVRIKRNQIKKKHICSFSVIRLEMDFTSSRSVTHPAAVCRTPRSPPPCDRAFVYFFCIVIFINVAANTSSASRLIISTRALQIQLGASFHFVSSAQQLKSFLGAAVIYYTTLTFSVGSLHVFVSLTNLLKP